MTLSERAWRFSSLARFVFRRRSFLLVGLLSGCVPRGLFRHSIPNILEVVILFSATVCATRVM